MKEGFQFQDPGGETPIQAPARVSEPVSTAPAAETPPREDLSSGPGAASLIPAAPRVAVYAEGSLAPQVDTLQSCQLPDVLADLTSRVMLAVADLGGCVPEEAVREVVANLVHAAFKDVVITVSDGGNTIRVADRGPGVRDKERALRPGFSTADSFAKQFIRGVGAGLPLARASLARAGGDLEVDDNLDGGTVVTLTVPPPLPVPAADSPVQVSHPDLLTDRQLQILLLVVELGPVGPTRLAEELGISPSTAYREAVMLDSAALVTRDRAGRRTVTEGGLAYLEHVL